MPNYFDENTQTEFPSFEEYKQVTLSKYKSLKSALSFIQKYAKKYTKNDFKLALESLQFNQDSSTLEEKEFISILREASEKVDLKSLYNSFNFFCKFANNYTKGDLFVAMQSLQLNQDCLTRPEKKHFFLLMKIR